MAETDKDDGDKGTAAGDPMAADGTAAADDAGQTDGGTAADDERKADEQETGKKSWWQKLWKK